MALLVPVNLLEPAVAGLPAADGILLEAEAAEVGRLGIRVGPADLLEGSDDSAG